MNMGASELTVALLEHIAEAARHRREHKSMIVVAGMVVLRVADPLPRILLNVGVRLGNVPVFVQEMLHQPQGKLLGTANAVLFGQQVDGVLLRIGGHNVRVVTYNKNME